MVNLLFHQYPETSLGSFFALAAHANAKTEIMAGRDWQIECDDGYREIIALQIVP